MKFDIDPQVPHLQFGSAHVFLGAQNGKFPDGNQVVVQGSDARIAFDTPLVSRQLLPLLRDADMVVLGHVHEDHTVALGDLLHVPVQVPLGDLSAIQSWDGLDAHFGYGAETMALLHPYFAQHFNFTPRPDATTYTDGALWELGGGVRVRAHHLPGHTAGHSALVVENEGLAFIGDIDLSGFGPYYGDASSDLELFRASLQKVGELDADIWVTSHHKAVIEGRAQFLVALQQFAAHIDARSERLLAYLREGPHTLEQLVARRLLYPQGAQSPHIPCVERRSISLHLQTLGQQGQVRQEGEQWLLA